MVKRTKRYTGKGGSYRAPFFMCSFCPVLAPFSLCPTSLANVHCCMVFHPHIVDGRRYITQNEALSILAEGPYESQLYEVLNCLGATRYRIDFTRNGKLVARVGAKRKVDVMDALFLAPELRFRLRSSMKTIKQHRGWV